MVVRPPHNNMVIILQPHWLKPCVPPQTTAHATSKSIVPVLKAPKSLVMEYSTSSDMLIRWALINRTLNVAALAAILVGQSHLLLHISGRQGTVPAIYGNGQRRIGHIIGGAQQQSQ